MGVCVGVGWGEAGPRETNAPCLTVSRGTFTLPSAGERVLVDMVGMGLGWPWSEGGTVGMWRCTRDHLGEHLVSASVEEHERTAGMNPAALTCPSCHT